MLEYTIICTAASIENLRIGEEQNFNYLMLMAICN